MMYIHCLYLHTDIYGTLEEHQILFIANAHSSMFLPMVLTLSAWTLGSGASSLLEPSCTTFWGGEEERASFNVHSHKHLNGHTAADATSRHTCTQSTTHSYTALVPCVRCCTHRHTTTCTHGLRRPVRYYKIIVYRAKFFNNAIRYFLLAIAITATEIIMC